MILIERINIFVAGKHVVAQTCTDAKEIPLRGLSWFSGD